jgi:hypothetical protein
MVDGVALVRRRAVRSTPVPMKLIPMLVSLPAAMAAAVIFSGCATVTRGTKDVLVIETDPPGATVTVAGRTGSTPTSFKLSRKFEGTVHISKDGYEPITIQVNSHPSTAGGAGMAGNVLVGGLIGMGVDAGFGSTNDLHPNPIKVSLVPLGAKPAVANPELAALVQQQEADKARAEAERAAAEADRATGHADATNADAAANSSTETMPANAPVVAPAS